ncbi:TIGR03086 family protein [Rugosimonospora africana]|uniref:TIGR03086 family protein n=1 Tax=Rugosimonospora africana TaxID=556532 RepID=A0A8J3VW43_9ACTN|nr:TIGR03086 family protein [Rugosimonospora africana]
MDSKHVVVPIRRLNRAFASTRAVLATVGPDQLDAPTPCASWDVHALINHFIDSARWAGAALGVGDQAVDADADAAEQDFLARYDESIALTLAAFEAEGALEKTVQLPFGEFTGVALMGMATTDQFTHGWDLARAIGHHTDLDPELADELLAQARETIVDGYRGRDGVALFGPMVEAPPDACPADRLAAFLGRSI